MNKPVEVTFHYGNSNYFRVNLPQNFKLGMLYEIAKLILNVEYTDVLYMICNGVLISDKKQFDQTFSDVITTLYPQDFQITAHAVLKNKVLPEDKYDNMINQHVVNWISQQNTSVQTINTNIPGFNTMLTGRAAGAGVNQLANQLINTMVQMPTTTTTNTIPITNLTDIAVTIDDESFESLTTIISVDELTEEQREQNCFCSVPLIDDLGADLRRLPCGHVFHHECIHHHLTNISINCPNCQQDIRSI